LSSPAPQLGAVTDAPGGDVVEVDLDHQLGAQPDPLEIAPGAPAALLARAALARLIRFQEGDKPLLLLRRQARAVSDDAQLLAVVEAEDQRTHGALRLARPPADDDGVDRPHALDLEHALALARPVRRLALLGDCALSALQPRLGLGGAPHSGHQLDGGVGEPRACEQLLQRGPPLVERPLEQALVLAGQQVERDVDRGRLAGEAIDPRLRGVNALAERVEVLVSLGVAHDDLPVEHIPPRGQGQLGEVASERASVARLQVDLVAVHERQTAEAVELDLVAVLVPLRQLLARKRERRLQRRRQRQAHFLLAFCLAPFARLG
jgi:hypothetical protein